MSRRVWKNLFPSKQQSNQVSDQRFNINSTDEDSNGPSQPQQQQPLAQPEQSPEEVRLIVIEGFLCPIENLLLDDYDDENAAGCSVKYEEDRFEATADIKPFKPEEITVTTTEEGRTIIIEGKHEEKLDDGGTALTGFKKIYVLPEEYDITKMESKWTSDGVLVITAPKTSKAIQQKDQVEDDKKGKK